MSGTKYLVLVIVATLFIGGCARSGDDNSEGEVASDTLQSVLRSGTIRAGYFIQPPAVMKDPNSGQVTGTFVDAIYEIARQANLNVELIEVDLARFAAGLQTGLYDVSIGPTFRTITRAKAVAFTDTIFYLGYDGVVKDGQSALYSSESDIDQPGVRVAVKEGSAIHTYVRNNFRNADVIVLSGTDLSLPLQAVSSGQADIGLMNEHTVEYYVRQNPNVQIVLKDRPIQVLGMSWAVRPADHAWLRFLNIALESTIATGQMSQWEREHYSETLRRVLVEPESPTVR